jgi:hypothetical protein
MELLVTPAYVASRRCGCASCDADRSEEENYRLFAARVDSVFRRAADKVFQILGPNCPALMALQFRVRNEYRNEVQPSPDPDYCCAFVRSTVIGQLGQITYKAVPIEPRMLKEYDSDSNITCWTTSVSPRTLIQC